MPDPITTTKGSPHSHKGDPEWRVPHGQRVYAIGDIHGRADLLDELHAHIIADSGSASPGTTLMCVYLGDYVDRGPDSRGVIDCLIGDPLPGFLEVHLKGNHEDMMLRFLDDPAQGWGWLANGGTATMSSYGLTLNPDSLADESMPRIRDEFAERLPRAHLDFLHSLAVSHICGDYFLVHAGIRPGVPLDNQSEDDFLWIRRAFLHSTTNHGKVVVHGHTPTALPDLRPNRIGIDTAAYASGVLTCLVLERAERRFLATASGSPPA